MSEEREDDDVSSSQTLEEDVKKMRPPNKKKFEEEMDILQAQIREKEAELENYKTISGTGSADQLKSLKAEKGATINRRKQIDADLEKLNKDIPGKMRQLSQLESSLYYKSEEKINTAIQRLEWNLKVQTFKLMEEKKIVSEIDSLKRSKKTLVQYLALKQEIAGIRDRQRRMREERDTYFRAVSHLKGREESLRQSSSSAKLAYAGCKKEIDELYERKRQMVAAFRKQKEDFQGVREKNRKESLKKRDVERKASVADKRKQKAELEAERLPYETHIHLCSTLINYLSRFNSLASQEPSLDSLSPASSTDEPELAEEIDDGQYVLLKKSDGFEGLDYSGGAKRLSKKNKRSRKQSSIKKITHTPEMLSQFSTLSLSAPTSTAEVVEAIDQLKAKKAFYEREQQPNEAASDAGISATESTICEMSRQASKTESCEGGLETCPGDQVYADLLYGCQDPQSDLPEGWDSEGAVGGQAASASWETLSPHNSDSTVEGAGSSNKSQSSVHENVGQSQDKRELKKPEVVISKVASGESETFAMKDEKSWSSNNNNDSVKNVWPQKQTNQLSPGKHSKAYKTSVDSDSIAQFKDSNSKNLDCRPKSKIERQQQISVPRGMPLVKQATSLLVSPPSSQAMSHSISITSPLDFPSLRSSSPAAVLSGSSNSSRTVLSSSADLSTRSPSSNIIRSPTSSAAFASQPKQTLAARLSASSQISGGMGQGHHSLSPQAKPSPTVLDSEDFPPLSQTTSRSRRNSSLSTKSSNGSSTNQDHWSHPPQSLAHVTTQISNLDLTGQPHTLTNTRIHQTSQSLPTDSGAVGSSSTLHKSTTSTSQPQKDPILVSSIPLADKSSTEKWVESSMAFTKDFSPICCEGKTTAALTESTRL